MKKVFKYAFAALVGVATLSSCSDEIKPAVVVEQSDYIPNGTRSFSFTMMVVPASTQGRTEGLSGATVTLVQGGNTVTKTTIEDGTVSFDNLKEGDVSWYVNPGSTSGLAMMSGISRLEVNSNYFNNENNSNQQANASYLVKLPSLNANLTGKVIGDFDFNASTNASGVAGVIVRLQYSFGGALQEQNGNKQQIEPNFYIVTTDATGSFTFSNVPALDNISGFNPSLSFYYVGNSAGKDVVFEGSRSISSTEVGAAKTYNIGEVELEETGYTSTITGLFFGDLAGVDKTSFLAAYDNAFGTSYEDDFGPLNGTENVVEVNGTIAAITTPGFTGISSYVVIGNKTVVGFIDSKNDTTASASYSDISDTTAAFNAANYAAKNKSIRLVLFNGIDAVTFENSSIFPAFNQASYTGVAEVILDFGNIGGQSKFVANTGADGRLSIAGLPADRSFTYTATYSREVTLPDGYTTIVYYQFSGSGSTVANKSIDLGVKQLTITDLSSGNNL